MKHKNSSICSDSGPAEDAWKGPLRRPSRRNRQKRNPPRQPPAWASKKCSCINGSPSPDPKSRYLDAPSMHSRPKADRRGRSCMATASPKTPKSSATPVKRPHRVQMCAGCSHMLPVRMRQVRPTTAPPPHQPPPASAEPRLGALNKWKDPDETRIRDPSNDNRNLERLVAH